MLLRIFGAMKLKLSHFRFRMSHCFALVCLLVVQFFF